MSFSTVMNFVGTEEEKKVFMENPVGRLESFSVNKEKAVMLLKTIDGRVAFEAVDNLDQWHEEQEKMAVLVGKLVNVTLDHAPIKADKVKRSGKVSASPNSKEPFALI